MIYKLLTKHISCISSSFIYKFPLFQAYPYIGLYCFSTHKVPFEKCIHLYLNINIAYNENVSWGRS